MSLRRITEGELARSRVQEILLDLIDISDIPLSERLVSKRLLRIWSKKMVGWQTDEKLAGMISRTQKNLNELCDDLIKEWIRRKIAGEPVEGMMGGNTFQKTAGYF